jgi:hypothetical protein
MKKAGDNITNVSPEDKTIHTATSVRKGFLRLPNVF